MNRKQISILIVLIACLAVPIYFVRNYSGGAVMEKDSTVYLVLGTARDGYRYSVFGMALDLVKQFFRAPLSPDDLDNSILIIRVDPSATDAHTAKYINERDKIPEHVTVYQDGIYAECAGVKLCKWTNNGFQSVSEDENRAFGGVGHLDRAGADNSMVNGWMRVCRRSARWFSNKPGGPVPDCDRAPSRKRRRFKCQSPDIQAKPST